AVDSKGNLIVADTSNNRVRKVSPAGEVSTLAGSGVSGYQDGPPSSAQFDGPVGVAVDRHDNVLVADTYNDRIRKVSADGSVSTLAGTGVPGLADGTADYARFDTPCGVAVDKLGYIYIADSGNNCIRKVDPQGQVMTLAGGRRGHEDGPAAAATF